MPKPYPHSICTPLMGSPPQPPAMLNSARTITPPSPPAPQQSVLGHHVPLYVATPLPTAA